MAYSRLATICSTEGPASVRQVPTILALGAWAACPAAAPSVRVCTRSWWCHSCSIAGCRAGRPGCAERRAAAGRAGVRGRARPGALRPREQGALLLLQSRGALARSDSAGMRSPLCGPGSVAPLSTGPAAGGQAQAVTARLRPCRSLRAASASTARGSARTSRRPRRVARGVRTRRRRHGRRCACPACTRTCCTTPRGWPGAAWTRPGSRATRCSAAPGWAPRSSARASRSRTCRSSSLTWCASRGGLHACADLCCPAHLYRQVSH